MKSTIGRALTVQPVRTAVRWYPKETALKPKGMYLLMTMPSNRFIAQPFVYGSYSKFVKTVNSIVTAFPDTSESTTSVRAEWQQFAKKAPISDDVNEFTRAFGLKCPLGNYLLGYETITASKRPIVVESFDGSNLVNTVAGDSVQWSHNLHPEPVRLWEETSARPEYDITIDIKTLEKFTVAELKDRIDRVNAQYGFKLNKGSKKTDLVQTLHSSYMLLSTMQKHDSKEFQSAESIRDKVSDATESTAGNITLGDISERVDPVVKRSKNDKAGLLTKVYCYNQSIDEGKFPGKEKVKSFSSANYATLVKKIQEAGAESLLL